MSFADRILESILDVLGVAYALGCLIMFSIGATYFGYLFWEMGLRSPADFFPSVVLLIGCIAGFVRVLLAVFRVHACFICPDDILLIRVWLHAIETLAITIFMLVLSFFPAIVFTFLFAAFEISPTLTALLIGALIALCVYLAFKWFSGREAPPIQSDDTKLAALAESARPARAVALDTPPKTETKEIRNVYSGAR